MLAIAICNSTSVMLTITCLHAAMPEVQWNISDTAVLNGSTNGSCTATGNPCPEAKVIIPNHCKYQAKAVTIDSYTVRVEFKILLVTKDCQEIYCHISNHRAPLFTKTLTIIPPVEDSKANSSIDDNKHNGTVVPEEITILTDNEAANSSNITEIDVVDYDNSNQSSGNAAKTVTMDMCALYVALLSVLYISLPDIAFAPSPH